MKTFKATLKPVGMRPFKVLICAANLPDAKKIAQREMIREGADRYVRSPYTNYNHDKSVHLMNVVSFKDRTKACSRLEANKAHYISSAFDGVRRRKRRR